MRPGPSDAELERARETMVEHHLRGRDIKDERVLAAFGRVRREEFVWEVDRDQAYADRPVRIGEGQTVSQPYMVALMTQWLGLGGGGPNPGAERVLEIGTGSGYQTAILAELAREVFTVERFESLSASARRRLDGLGCTNVRYRVGDGTLGWPEEAERAPFDAVIVTAGAPGVPEALKTQLAPGGRLVIPVGRGREQDLLVVARKLASSPEASGDAAEFDTRSVCPCIFVKLVGEQGWSEGGHFS
jgi:protein-L-isoaspartate(D-aspartate) O-methyltransferase